MAANERLWLFTRPMLLAYGWLAVAVVVALLLAQLRVTSGWDAAESGVGTATFLYALAWLSGFIRGHR